MIQSSKTSVPITATQLHISEEDILHSYRSVPGQVHRAVVRSQQLPNRSRCSLLIIKPKVSLLYSQEASVDSKWRQSRHPWVVAAAAQLSVCDDRCLTGTSCSQLQGLKLEVARSSKTSVTTNDTISSDHDLNFHCSENFMYYLVSSCHFLPPSSQYS